MRQNQDCLHTRDGAHMITEDDDHDNDDDDDNDDEYEEDETNPNSANFYATTSWFCMVIDLNETYMMMMMKMKMKLIITRPILKLQPPDFAW